MRGPLLSGALGSAATLARVCQRLGARSPIVVLRSLWLARTLATGLPIVALVDPADEKAARRPFRKAGPPGSGLTVVLAGVVPPGVGPIGALIIEGLAAMPREQATATLTGLAADLQPEGLLLALDRTKDQAIESRLTAAFLAAGFAGIGQERPREGALLTFGRAPHPAIRRALGSEAAV